MFKRPSAKNERSSGDKAAVAARNRRRWRAFIPLLLFIVCVLGSNEPPGPGTGPDDDPDSVGSGQVGLICPSYNSATSPLPSDLPATSLDDGTVAGTIPGSFAVSATGDATYTVPLVTPPGRAGMQPALAITYQSSAGEGLLGVGFSLQGLSAITRCPANLAQDGRIAPVVYDDTDNFCLDGARLVVVGETFSADGSGMREYRTFPDTFAKVVAHYDAGTTHERGPAYFEVFAKTGRIIEYGGVAAGRAMATRGVVASWWVTKERDRRGNAIAYTYENDIDADGHTLEMFPRTIEYAHDADGAATRIVEIVPEAIPQRTFYSHGMRLIRSKVVSSIWMRLEPNGKVVRTYGFVYDDSEGTARPLLRSILECAPTSGVCKTATSLSWSSQPNVGLSPTPHVDVPTEVAAAPSGFTWLTADVNGDGLPDLVVASQGEQPPCDNPVDCAQTAWPAEWYVALNNGTSFLPWKSWIQLPSGGDFPYHGIALDYDQDGRTDILFTYGFGFVHYEQEHALWGGLAVLRSRPNDSFELIDIGITPPNPATQSGWRLGDVDGDGVADYIQCTFDTYTGTNAWTVQLWKPSGPTGPGFSSEPITIPHLESTRCDVIQNKDLKIVDIDGDGRADIVVPGGPNHEGPTEWDANGVPRCATWPCTYRALVHEDDGWREIETNLLMHPRSPVQPGSGAGLGETIFLDVNTDGLPDAIQTGYQDGKPRTFLNTGNGFTSGVPSLGDMTLPSGYRLDYFARYATPIDYNGDGLADILLPMHYQCADPADPAPCWVVLEASLTGSGSFTVRWTGIAFVSEPSYWKGLVTGALGPGAYLSPADVDGNGRHDLVMRTLANDELGNAFRSYKSASLQDLLTEIHDGTNPLDWYDSSAVATVSIKYGGLIDKTITHDIAATADSYDDQLYVSHFDAANECAYPLICAVGPQRVVAGYTMNNGANLKRTFSVKYRDGRYHRLGRGFLGFGARILLDEDTAAGSADFYDNVTYVSELSVFPFAGQAKQSWTWAPRNSTWPYSGQVELTFTTRMLQQVPTNQGATYFTLPLITTVEREEGLMSPGKTLFKFVAAADATPATMLSRTWNIISDYDEYGNIREEVMHGDGVDLQVAHKRQYVNDAASWLIGRVEVDETCSTAIGVTQCRTVNHQYNGYGEVISSKSGDPGDPHTQLSAGFAHDKFGNVVSTRVSDAYGHTRDACTSFDEEGIFPYASANSLGHVTYTSYDRGLGVVKAVVDANGLVTQRAYDPFGRVLEEVRPDGTQTTVSLTRIKDNGPFANWYGTRVVVQRSGGEHQTMTLDSLGRVVRVLTQGADVMSCGASVCTQAPQIKQTTTYDFLGRVARVTVPWMDGDALTGQLAHLYQYDPMGRLVSHTEPWGRVTTFAYGNNLTTTTDPFGSTTTEVDALGRVVQVTDKKHYTTQTTYGPFSTVWQVTRHGETTIMEHDAYGRVVHEVDPDRGDTYTQHDGFGEVTSMVDALHRSYAFTYDALGRLVRRDDDDGKAVSTTTWDYDIAENGIGKLASVTSPAGHVKRYSYDYISRPSSIELDLKDEKSTSLAAHLGYDSYGRLKTVGYPQVEDIDPVVVRRDYDAFGNVIAVRDNATNVAYWQLNYMDGAGRPTLESMANGVTTHHDYYADSGRVAHITTAKGAEALQDLEYAYDLGTRMVRRTDWVQQTAPHRMRTEHFVYDELDRLTCAYFSFDQLNYSTQPSGPCALSVTYAPNGNIDAKSDVGAYKYEMARPHVLASAGADTFTHDAVGNQTARPGMSRISYTAFDLPSSVTFEVGKEPSIFFEYDGTQNRIRKTTPFQEITYLEGLYERERELASGVVTHRYYVPAGSATAVLTRTAGAPNQIAYAHTEALGSTDIVTDGTGNAAERRSHDAFGARRNPEWGQTFTGTFTSKATSRGFTGHESDDDLGLVNMKGRIYDPRIGRFLAMDPVVSQANSGQGWNPYSYVMNSPTNLVDPSGYQEASTGTIDYWGVSRATFTVTEYVQAGPFLQSKLSDIRRANELRNGDTGHSYLMEKDAGRDETAANRRAAIAQERQEFVDYSWRHGGAGGAPPEGWFPSTPSGELLGVEQVMDADLVRGLATAGVKVAARVALGRAVVESLPVGAEAASAELSHLERVAAVVKATGLAGSCELGKCLARSETLGSAMANVSNGEILPRLLKIDSIPNHWFLVDQGVIVDRTIAQFFASAPEVPEILITTPGRLTVDLERMAASYGGLDPARGYKSVEQLSKAMKGAVPSQFRRLELGTGASGKTAWSYSQP